MLEVKLPVLKLRLAPDSICCRCGQHSGYVEEKCRLCLACLNLSLLVYSKWKIALKGPAIAQKQA